MSGRSKHIDTRMYRLRDLVRDKVLKLVKIETQGQMADGLTKAMPAPAVATFSKFMAGPAWSVPEFASNGLAQCKNVRLDNLLFDFYTVFVQCADAGVIQF